MSNPLRALPDRFARKIAHEVWKSPRPTPGDRYLAIATLQARHNYTALSASEVQVFSQNGEDGVLAEIFARIGTTDRSFVEFGAHDGVECNTRFLMEVLGWSGVYIESDSGAFSLLSESLINRSDVVTLQAFVTSENVNEIFASAAIPREMDLLSVDIDGQDYWVWDALDGYRARVVVIEYNATLPAQSRLVEEKGTVHQGYTRSFGASVGALRALGEKKGYKLVHADLAGVNLFFVRDDLAIPFDDPLLRGASYHLARQGHPGTRGEYVEV